MTRRRGEGVSGLVTRGSRTGGGGSPTDELKQNRQGKSREEKERKRKRREERRKERRKQTIKQKSIVLGSLPILNIIFWGGVER